MVEIKYRKTDSGLDNAFYLSYPLHEYIQPAFFEQHEKGEGAKLYFLIALLDKHGMIDHSRYQGIFWNTRFDCVYEGIEFEMLYDNDWDFVWFFSYWRSKEDKIKVAERIKELIETEGPGTEFTGLRSDTLPVAFF